jgi:methionyl-tRNA formyltransferase
MLERRVDLILNVHSLEIVDATLLDAPRLGAYNLHPGPLPERAGLHSPSWAIYEGATRHGVTLHRMVPEIDAGPIAFSDTFQIGPADTGLSVMTQCIRRGLELIERLLDVVERGAPIPARAQNLAERQWFPAGPPQDGRVDWRRPADRIAGFVRACDYRPFTSPWGFPRCGSAGLDVAIRDARVIHAPLNAPAGTAVHARGGAVCVAASDGWVRVENVEVDGEVLPAAEAISDGVLLS